MTLDELRKLRDVVVDLELQRQSVSDGEDADNLYIKLGHALDAYEGSAINYVDNLLDAMPK